LIAGSVVPQSGHITRHNLEQGQSLSHNYDMHGGRDRKDGSNTAGSRIEVYNNTFLDRECAIGTRGRPDEYARIYSNWFTKHYNPGSLVIFRWPPADTIELGDNLYGANRPIVHYLSKRAGGEHLEEYAFNRDLFSIVLS